MHNNLWRWLCSNSADAIVLNHIYSNQVTIEVGCASTSIYMARHGNTINQEVAVIFVVANVCDYKFNF